MKIVLRWIGLLLWLSLFPTVFAACDDGFPGNSVLRKKEIYDPGCTGKAYYCRLYYYDKQGDFVLAAFDHDCNGVGDERERISESSIGWDQVEEMNAAGEDLYSNPDPFRYTDLLPASVDDPDPWEYNVPSGGMYTYSSCAETIVEEERRIVLSNQDCDSTTNDCTVYFKDENGLVLSYGKDDGCDGTLDSTCIRWTYNDAGRVLSETTDTDCNGKPDEDCREWTYNEFNQPTEYGRSEDCTGIWDTNCKIWRYDEEGRQTYYARSKDCNDIADADCTRWMYDDDGNLVQVFYGKDCDEVLTLEMPTCEVWKWTDDGKFLEYHKDLYCDGINYSKCRMLSYDEKGRIVEYRREEDCNGVGDTCKSYRYKEKH